MWNLTGYHCPICGNHTHQQQDHDEGRLYESEEECRTCKEWSEEFSYGHYRERIGFEEFEWSYSDVSSHYDERKQTIEEMKRVYTHPEYQSMLLAPMWALADWLGDHEFLLQEAAVRRIIGPVN